MRGADAVLERALAYETCRDISGRYAWTMERIVAFAREERARVLEEAASALMVPGDEPHEVRRMLARFAEAFCRLATAERSTP